MFEETKNVEDCETASDGKMERALTKAPSSPDRRKIGRRDERIWELSPVRSTRSPPQDATRIEVKLVHSQGECRYIKQRGAHFRGRASYRKRDCLRKCSPKNHSTKTGGNRRLRSLWKSREKTINFFESGGAEAGN
jgi:hypothetical protein